MSYRLCTQQLLRTEMFGWRCWRLRAGTSLLSSCGSSMLHDGTIILIHACAWKSLCETLMENKCSETFSTTKWDKAHASWYWNYDIKGNVRRPLQGTLGLTYHEIHAQFARHASPLHFVHMHSNAAFSQPQRLAGALQAQPRSCPKMILQHIKPLHADALRQALLLTEAPGHGSGNNAFTRQKTRWYNMIYIYTHTYIHTSLPYHTIPYLTLHYTTLHYITYTFDSNFFRAQAADLF